MRQISPKLATILALPEYDLHSAMILPMDSGTSIKLTASEDSVASEPLVGSDKSDESGQPGAAKSEKTSPKGRVRTGCLVCRTRKIKCDELRPCCGRCAKSKKMCVYRPTYRRGWLLAPDPQFSPMDGKRDQFSQMTNRHVTLIQPGHEAYTACEQPTSARSPFGAGAYRTPRSLDDREGPRQQSNTQPDLRPQESQPASTEIDTAHDPLSSDVLNREAMLHITETSATQFQMASRIFYLTLNMDKVMASEEPTQPSFSYFFKEVDCPFISPFEHLNWARIKALLVKIAAEKPLIAKSLTAIQALYRAQVDLLPTVNAISMYEAAVASLQSALVDDGEDFATIIFAIFLLCLFKLTLPNGDCPTFDGLDENFTVRLKDWLSSADRSPVFLRIGAWLELMDAATKRAGSPGLLPDTITNLLCSHIPEVPSLSALDQDTYPANSLYDNISAPLFNFYLSLQRISSQVENASHYRRSRITPADQEEVNDMLTDLKTKLYSFWESRPGLLRLQPFELREHFSHSIAEPLISFCGVCLAAYFTEFIGIGRVLGYPSFPTPEAEDAKKQIRDIIEGDWNTTAKNGLHPGYLRPLFLYGIETFEPEGTQWAVSRLRQIKNPLSRAGFFASFVELHGEQQRKQRRRVTKKYFCCQTFGVPLPFL